MSVILETRTKREDPLSGADAKRVVRDYPSTSSAFNTVDDYVVAKYIPWAVAILKKSAWIFRKIFYRSKN